MNKISVISPANIAFIKYWGRADHKLFIPRNDSISVTTDKCLTKATIQLIDEAKDDINIKFYGKDYQKLVVNSEKTDALVNQINRIRQLAKSKLKVKIYSENNFPADAGIAASASSFSAITAGLLLIFSLKDKFKDKEELSRQIRLCGSSSAVRSAMGGFVKLKAGNNHQSCHAVQIAPENHWDLVDIVAVVDPEKKKVSSSLGHELADTSPYYETRIKEMQQRIKQCEEAILQKDIEKLGDATEKDAISMHAIMMTSNPPGFYWSAGSMVIIHAVRNWREEEGLQVYYTFDAGANPHLICEAKDKEIVKQKLKTIPFVKWTIENHPCQGVHQIDEHLF
ncbi:diphosphomevalonate decarboxylase [Candidatus Beckwithbacteria bacterium]|nr:diphosphomevalonate decarboxylase [Candidatus Beckwithbacteria bacterium]